MVWTASHHVPCSIQKDFQPAAELVIKHTLTCLNGVSSKACLSQAFLLKCKLGTDMKNLEISGLERWLRD